MKKMNKNMLKLLKHNMFLMLKNSKNSKVNIILLNMKKKKFMKKIKKKWKKRLIKNIIKTLKKNK